MDRDGRAGRRRWAAGVVGALLVVSGGAGRAVAGSPSAGLSGRWALEGTGPAGLVNSGGRIGVLHLRQHGHALTFTLTSGRHRYGGSGVATWPPPRLTLTWRMPGVGLVRFSGGTLVHGRILGQWSDGHGDDGGTLLVRLGR
ncbi:MAG TPA: hypothetical protein VMV23_13445 [Candidatus Nanopelagicaceae bacterium]|nr:hypothetical protein [Candidatus Nanopelagicaceae bacterium]